MRELLSLASAAAGRQQVGLARIGAQLAELREDLSDEAMSRLRVDAQVSRPVVGGADLGAEEQCREGWPVDPDA